MEKKTGAIRNLDQDTTQNGPNMYEYAGQITPSPIGSFEKRPLQKPLGHLAGNRSRLRSQEVSS